MQPTAPNGTTTGDSRTTGTHANSSSTRASGDREPLSRERILITAVAIADQHGVGELSMRKLAKELGFEVMSLYNHVDSKDDLLDGMVDLVAAEIDEPAAGMAWQPAVRAIAMSAHDALVRHRWAAALWSQRWPGAARWRHMEVILDLLANADFPDDVADLAFHAVTMHIQGFTQQQITYAQQAIDEAEMFERFHREVSEEEFPEVHAHVRYHLESTASHDEFGFVLDLILDGLERARTA
jgi:AcrR family transcriptional regulator